jgi:tetratricopeptide (TPR) repeat protein
MGTRLLLISTLFISTFQWASAQNQAEEEAIMKVIRIETESFLKRDSVNWKDQFIQNDKTLRVYSGFTFFQNNVGWINFAPLMLTWIKENPQPSRYTDLQLKNQIITVSDNLAWVAYDQSISIPGVDSIAPSGSREFRTLVKENDRWKITSLITIDTATHIRTTPQIMEYIFNDLGYRYLEDDKIEEAVEVFKLNVKLYPTAWNTYDSLGEAYAKAGNKDLAIENYKRSIELNPENEHGKDMLAKLNGM